MISAFFVFLLLFVLTNGVFSLAVSLCLFRFDKEQIIAPFQKLVFSLALGPFFTSLLLYYLLWLVPGLAPIFYVSVITLFFIVLALINIKYLPSLISAIQTRFHFINRTSENDKNKFLLDLKFIKLYSSDYTLNYFNIITFIVLIILLWKWMWRLISEPIIGHDMLEYAIQAKYFALHRLIEYVENRYHPETEFFYVGLHGFSFPLLGSWEVLFSELFGKTENDYYFKSITGYYSFLIFFTQFFWLKRVNIWLATVASIALFFTYGFFITITEYHIDSYRIFMIIAALISLAYAINYHSGLTLVLLGIFAGAQAFIHSFGVFVSVFIVIAFFLFYKSTWQKKIIHTLLITAIIMLMGGIHYVMDVLFGTGWIFQEIKYY
ncbi:MAG: hypothetical protein ACK4IK_06490 [Bacteroidia bacterium]